MQGTTAEKPARVPLGLSDIYGVLQTVVLIQSSTAYNFTMLYHWCIGSNPQQHNAASLFALHRGMSHSLPHTSQLIAAHTPHRMLLLLATDSAAVNRYDLDQAWAPSKSANTQRSMSDAYIQAGMLFGVL